MTIDSILNPHQATSTQVADAFRVTAAVAEAIRESGEIPSGHLYTMLIGKVTLEGYWSIIRVLKKAGLVEESAHLLKWVGPKLEAK